MTESFSPIFVDCYDPLRAGSIDGTDQFPHDRAIAKALVAKFKPNKFVRGEPECTLFVGRLGPQTTEETIMKTFKQFGKINFVRLVKDIVTGSSKCYAFVEFKDEYQARSAARNGHKLLIDEHEVLVELEKGRTLKGWVPRRLGGGLGGKRESGQLRFGGKDRPFRKPILRQDVDREPACIDNHRRKNRSRSRERYRSKSKERRSSRERHRSREKYKRKHR